MCVQADYVVNVFNIGGITSVGLYQVSTTPHNVLTAVQSLILLVHEPPYHGSAADMIDW